jgi:hypothetical protein
VDRDVKMIFHVRYLSEVSEDTRKQLEKQLLLEKRATDKRECLKGNRASTAFSASYLMSF